MTSLRAEKRAWRKKNAAEIERVAQEPLGPLDEMPFTSVTRNGVEFRVHGLAHGQRRALKLRPRVRTWMRERLEDMIRPPDEDFVTERRFARLLGFGRDRELDYLQKLLREVGPRKVLLLTLVALFAPVLLPLASVVFRFARDPVTREVRASLNDERHLVRLRKLYALTELPAARAYELRPDGFNRVHSRLMAESAVAHAEMRGLKVLHVVCGLAHEADLVYLLGS
jgi:hypothetical protein